MGKRGLSLRDEQVEGVVLPLPVVEGAVAWRINLRRLGGDMLLLAETEKNGLKYRWHKICVQIEKVEKETSTYLLKRPTIRPRFSCDIYDVRWCCLLQCHHF